MITRHSRIALAALAVGAVVTALPACATPSDPEDTTSIVISVGAGAIPVLWNPLGNSWELNGPVPQALYDSLFMEDLHGNIEPWLAEDFELSDDRKTLVLNLRDDVDFHDGTHLDAEIVDEYLTAASRPSVEEGGAVWGGSVGTEAGVEIEVTGEYQLTITSENAMDYFFFSGVARMPIASPLAIEDPDAVNAVPAGTGPYLIDETVPEVSISFVRNPDYWNAEAFPYDEVTFTVFADPIASLNALKSGQVDVSSALTSSLATEAEADGFQLHPIQTSFAALFILDREGISHPALADVRVRQAINMAFDKESILEALYGGYGVVSSQPFRAPQPEYLEGRDDEYSFDPERARELIAEAGYPDGFDLLIPTLAGWTDALLPIVEQSLTDIGIRVQFEQIADFGALVTEAWPGDRYGAALASFPYERTLQWILPGEGPDFFMGGYKDAHAEELDSTIKFGTASESAEASQELGRLLLEGAWYAPFAHPATQLATTPAVDVIPGGFVGSTKLWQFVPADE